MVTGFNIYGMWEEPSTAQYFDNPSKRPDDLRPWLISRKYSYERDLKGAFPSEAGDHPALTQALEDPPWQPVLLRATKITNQNDSPEGEALPNVFRKDCEADVLQTYFSIDLRNGMDSGLEVRQRRFVGWDTQGVIKLEWTPRFTRDGELSGVRPQRYRFWVTATDAFEQESEPIAIATQDGDAKEGESVLFEPRYRASLLPPQAGPERLTLQWTPAADDRSTITVRWETPFLNDLGRSSASTPGRADKKDLLGAVKLLRRRLRRKVDDGASWAREALTDLRPADDVFATPQWTEVLEPLRSEGWQEFKMADRLLPPASGDTWQFSFDLEHSDRGFEYIALIGMRVRPDRAAFWRQDVLARGQNSGRRAFVAVKDGSEWKAVQGRVTETPRTTATVPTVGWVKDGEARAGVLPVPNLAEPRGVTLVAARIYRAEPIRPLPRVARDLVLLRLLTRAVEKAPVQPPTWLDTCEPVTLGQAAMLEAALERTAELVDPLHNVALRDARLILARELRKDAAKEDGRAYRQNMMIGFRGVVELRWRYSPLTSKAPRRDESEAEKLRVFCVRVPRDTALASRYAALRAEGNLSEGLYELTGVAADHPVIVVLAAFHQPALVRIEPSSGGPALYGGLTDLKMVGSRVQLRVVVENGDLPKAVTISLFLAQPVCDWMIDAERGDVEESMFLPVGGGQSEVFGWWLQTSSVQGVVSGHRRERRPFFFSHEMRTIEPEIPVGFTVNLPARSEAAYAADPKMHEPWLPTEIANGSAHQAQHSPRVLVGWNAYPAEEGAGIEIEREERLVEQESGPRSLDGRDTAAWEAARAIDQMTDDALIMPAWVTAIRSSWLLGRAVEVPGDAGGPNSVFILADVKQPLSGSQGLKLLDGRPVFIDYFRRAKDKQAAMDGNWEYRYRIRAWLDVLVDARPDVDPDSRILRGSPTPWSEWILPEPGEATLVVDPAHRHKPHDRDTPAVTFSLTAVGSGFRELVSPKEGWFYRVVIKRRLEFFLPSTEQTIAEPGWREVGTSLVVPPDGTTVEVADLRIGRSEVDRPVTLTYQISANQLIITPSGRERLVRVLAKQEFPVTILPPPNPEGNELMALVRVQIK